MFSWKKWFIKLGKKILLVIVVEGGIVTANYLETTAIEMPEAYVQLALILSVILSQTANIIKHRKDE